MLANICCFYYASKSIICDKDKENDNHGMHEIYECKEIFLTCRIQDHHIYVIFANIIFESMADEEHVCE